MLFNEQFVKLIDLFIIIGICNFQGGFLVTYIKYDGHSSWFTAKLLFLYKELKSEIIIIYILRFYPAFPLIVKHSLNCKNEIVSRGDTFDTRSL